MAMQETTNDIVQVARWAEMAESNRLMEVSFGRESEFVCRSRFSRLSRARRNSVHNLEPEAQRSLIVRACQRLWIYLSVVVSGRKDVCFVVVVVWLSSPTCSLSSACWLVVVNDDELSRHRVWKRECGRSFCLELFSSRQLDKLLLTRPSCCCCC